MNGVGVGCGVGSTEAEASAAVVAEGDGLPVAGLVGPLMRSWGRKKTAIAAPNRRSAASSSRDSPRMLRRVLTAG